MMRHKYADRQRDYEKSIWKNNTPKRSTLEFGENLKRLRKEREMKVKELAAKAGIGLSTLYKMEKGSISPTVLSLYKLARALEIPVGALLPPDPTEPVTYHRFGKGKPLKLRRSGITAVRVSSTEENRRLYALMITLKPGGSTTKDPVSHQGEEIITVLEGTVMVTVATGTYILHRGDVLHYPSSLPHRITNKGDAKAILFYVLTLSPLFSPPPIHG